MADYGNGSRFERKPGFSQGLAALLSGVTAGQQQNIENRNTSRGMDIKQQTADAYQQSVTPKDPMAMIQALQPFLSSGKMRISGVGANGQPVFASNEPAPARQLNAKEQYDFDTAKKADEMKAENIRNSAEDTLATTREVRKGLKYFGPMGKIPTIMSPSTLEGEYDERKNWEANVDKLLASLSLDKINEMKSASRTGATGFGALNEKELKVLTDAASALRRDLSPADAEKYIGEIEKVHNKVLGNTVDDPEEAEARAAIDAGADPKAVMERLAERKRARGQ